MKSIKILVGALVCLMLLSGQAMAVESPAVTLTFDNVYDDYSGSLDRYGNNYDVSFVGWGASEIGDDVELMGKARATSTTSTITFRQAPVSLFAIDIDLTGSATMTATTSTGATHFINLTDMYELAVLPTGWSDFLISSIKFDLGEYSTLFVDNVAYTPTPVPGAAILLGSGLLGLVGLRRRELV